MSEGPKRRFIAGAVCPRCAELDRIVMYEQGDEQHRECVACGFTDATGASAPAADAALPPGRLDTPRPRPTTAAQPIRFYPRKVKPESDGD